MIAKLSSRKLVILLICLIAVAFISIFTASQNVHAAADRIDVTNCSTNDSNAFNPNQNCLTALPKVSGDNDQLQNGMRIVFGVAAGVALISLAIAAFNYTTASTDTEKISRSKQAIVFSLLGLVIALSAEAIIITVIGRL